MASLYIPSCNATFLHLPKTAGYSISTALADSFADAEPYPTRGMDRLEGTAAHVARRLGRDIFARSWSFCFLRNPWDWTVSGWRFVTSNKNAYGDAAPSFERFVRGGWKDGARHNPHPRKFTTPELYVAFHTQVTQDDHLIALDGTEPVPMAFYARFEHLSQDWSRICDRLGRDIVLPHMNRTDRGHYTDYYTDELRAIVARRNARLIDRFGYRFGD